MMVPKSVNDPEQIAYILDAMGYYGQQIIKPAYYDVVLKRKLTRDNESEAMLDLIFSSTSYDLGRFANFGQLASAVESMMTNGTNTYASAYEKAAPRAEKAIETLLKKLDE
ncbi:hypothetical protein FACS1894105_12290 [Clostridia bacterium]|nr:hypothetical protein FACS1894105_12290 [Clostridia bacterium]